MAKRCVIWCAVSSDEQAKDDKLSLVTQQTEMEAIAHKEGWEILKVFMWDGYSRWESDPIAALEDFAEQQRFEYHELRRMWRASEFDVLMLYTHSRAGRSFTMQSWVVENVIRHGGEIYRVHGGWINKKDYAFQIGIGGVLSTNDIDRLVEQRRIVMFERAKQGLPTSTKPLFSHMVRRDKKGKPVKNRSGQLLPMAVDESLRSLWDHVAFLLLEGISYHALETELFNRYGHVDVNGRPYPVDSMHLALINPTLWGNSARFYNMRQKRGRRFGAWAYDPSVTPPDGVVVYYDTHPPVYTGEIAAQVKAELDRRMTVSKGRSSSRGTNRFTGLLICAGCSYYLGYDRTKVNIYISCGSRSAHTARFERPCAVNGRMLETQIQNVIDQVLRNVVKEGTLAAAFGAVGTQTIPIETVASIQADIEAVEAEARQTIVFQRKAAKSLSHLYDEDLEHLGARLEKLKNNLERVRSLEQRANRQNEAEREVIADLRKITIENFWTLPDQTINQMLHRLLGSQRFVVSKTGIEPFFAEKPPRKRV